MRVHSGPAVRRLATSGTAQQRRMATTQAVQPSRTWNREPVRDAQVQAVPAEAIEHTIRHTTLRGVGFVGLLAVALIHLLDVISKISETPYLGVMYIVLMVASVTVAFVLLH